MSNIIPRFIERGNQSNLEGVNTDYNISNSVEIGLGEA